jgi:hypothetical protein
MLRSTDNYPVSKTPLQLSDRVIKVYKNDQLRLRSKIASKDLYYYSDNGHLHDINNKSDIHRNSSDNGYEINKNHSSNSNYNQEDTTDNKNNLSEVNYGPIPESQFNGSGDQSRISEQSTKISSRHRNRTGVSKIDSNRARGFTKLQQKRTKPFTVKKKFKRPYYYKAPVSYDSLSSNLSLGFPDDLPIFTNRPEKCDFLASDEARLSYFINGETKICTNLQYLLCGSILCSFHLLGLPIGIKEQAGQIETYSIRKSVLDLAKNTNSGWEDFGKKNDPKIINKTINWVTDYLRKPTFYRLQGRFLKGIKEFQSATFTALDMIPTYIMHRVQISPIYKLGKYFEVKIRQVWCVPYTIVALENMFFGPMIELLKSKAKSESAPIFPIGLNNKQLSDRVALDVNRKLRRNLSKKARSFDFSKFDSNIHTFFTSAIFTIWESNLKFTPRRRLAYNALRFYTCYTPFIHEGQAYVTEKGVCSGSFTTNARDTIVNLALVICALRIKYRNPELADKILRNEILELEHTDIDFRREIRFNLNHITVVGTFIYGDDGIMVESDDFFIIHKFVCQNYGLEISYEKPISYGESFFFLGRFWDTDGKPWHTKYYMMAHIMFRSKWYNSEDVDFDISEYLDLYRVLSICLPLRDGKAFLYRCFGDWKPFQNFVEGDKGYFLLKEFPHDEYQYIERHKAFHIESY